MADIFVFGSNLAGRHGAGAAKYAVLHHGAVYGVGEGCRGDSYAIPTKDHQIKTLPLDRIAFYVERFKQFAATNPDLIFNVTPIGCGLAGYRRDQIRPMFADMPKNCRFSESWNDSDVN